jgi:hypothetical protein
MAINIPIITSLEDTGIKNAKAAFNDFKSAVGKAEGGMGKFKAGSKVALDAVKANAAGFAIAGGAALASFATKAISAFQDLALGAGLFADATGLAVEDASRYMEVAGDLGISVDSVKTAIGRLNKTIGADPDKVRKLGVDMVYLNDGSLDVNETFINTIERIKGIKDPAEKATVAAQLLGKGWQGMAELINLGSEELRKSLDSVSNAQVISDEELKKAKEYRDTIDELGDLWNSFVINAGGVFVGIVSDLKDLTSWEGLGRQLKEGPLGRALGELGGLFNDNEENAKAAEEAAKDLGDAYSGYVSSRLAESRQELALLNGELEDQDDGLAILTTAWQTLLGTLDTRETFDNLDASLERVFEAGVKAFGGGAEEIRDFNSAQKNAIEQIADLARAMDLTFGEQNKLKIFVDSGDLAGARDLLESLQRIANMGPIYDSGIARAIRGRRAMGGPVGPGGSYLVGERGPELFTPTSSGNITANSALGGGGNTVTINVNGGDPMQVVKALQTYVRTIGPVPVNTRTM